MARDAAYGKVKKKIEEAWRSAASASHHTDRRIPLNGILSSLEPIPSSKVRRTLVNG